MASRGPNIFESKWRMGVPVATPIDARCLMAAVRGFFDRNERKAFEAQVQSLLGVPLVRSTKSGRSALFLTLQAMRQMSQRDEVVTPASVCPSVGRAVVKAGLKVVLCDVASGGSGLDLKSLERNITPRTLAVISAHLYGYPCEIASILDISHAKGAMVIEDCAQAFGAKLHGRFVGTMADAGVFSFGMSKALWANGGGLICSSHSELCRLIDHLVSTLPSVSKGAEALKIVTFAALSYILRGRHLGPIAAVWNKALRGRKDTSDFGVGLFSPSSAAAGRVLLSRLAEITRIRRRNAQYLSQHLTAFDEIRMPEPVPDSEPVFLRFPIVVEDTALKQRLLAELRSAGINPSEMYGLESYEALKTFASRESRCPRAEYLAPRMLNLPTHPYIRNEDLCTITDIFGSILSKERFVTEHNGSAMAAL